MSPDTQTAAEFTERGIRLARLFDAPPAAVFAAWSEAANLDQWWGPDGFRNETHSMDFEVGGEWRYVMHGPDGTDFPNRILYRQIEAPHRLEFLHDAGEEDDPQAMEVTVTFEAQGEQTLLTMHTQFASAAIRDEIVKQVGAVEGGKQTLNHLAQYLADHPLRITL